MFRWDVEFWRDFFGINDFEIGCRLKSLTAANAAETEVDMVAGLARIYLADTWKEEVDIEEIRLTAFHEVLEVLFGEMEELICKCRLMNEDDLTNALQEKKHKIIHHLEYAIFYGKGLDKLQ